MKKVFRLAVLIVPVILYVGMAIAEYERASIPLDGSPSRGPANAKVTIVEFLDYQ